MTRFKGGRAPWWTDEQVIDALRQFYALHGRGPKSAERTGMEAGVPSDGLMRQRFGSAREAFVRAGIPLTAANRPHHDYPKRIGRPRKYSDDQLIAAMKQTAAALGRVPKRREMRPDFKIYVDRFGSWNRAVTLAGLTPRAPGQWFERKPKPVAPAPPDIRDYWRQVDPAVCSAERSEAAPQLANPHPTWTHPYARRSA